MPVNDVDFLDKRTRQWNKIYRSALLMLATVTTVGVIIGVREVFVVGHKIDENVQNTQMIIQNNQASTLQARKDNITRQNDLKNYVKCIALAPFDVPASELSTRTGSEKALDNCAKVQ